MRYFPGKKIRVHIPMFGIESQYRATEAILIRKLEPENVPSDVYEGKNWWKIRLYVGTYWYKIPYNIPPEE